MFESLSPRLAPATRFLLTQVCGLSPGHETSPVPLAELAAEARAQRIAGLLRLWAENAGDQALRDALGSALHANAIHALAVVREALQVANVLAQHGVRTIVLKGPLLSRRYYGDFGTRDAGDLDMLVDAADVPRADAALRASGYTRTKPSKNLSAARLALYLRTQHEFGYRAPGHDLLVELHWRHADAPELAPYPFETLWRSSLREDVAGGSVRVLSDRDTFVHLAIHGALDGWSRLKWLADLPRVLAKLAPADFDAIRSEAQAMGHARMLELALALAGHSEPPAWLGEVTPRIVRRLADAGAPRTLDVVRGDRRYLQCLADNRRMRRAVAYSSLIMPGDFDRLPLPDGLTAALPYVAQGRRFFSKLLPGAR